MSVPQGFILYKSTRYRESFPRTSNMGVIQTRSSHPLPQEVGIKPLRIVIADTKRS